jgi:hypothetical protein
MLGHGLARLGAEVKKDPGGKLQFSNYKPLSSCGDLAIATPPGFDSMDFPNAGFGGGYNGLEFRPRMRAERP